MIFFKVIRLFARSLTRIADALEEIRDLYKLELDAQGIRPITLSGSKLEERVEIVYGAVEEESDVFPTHR
jgi:hypothetical protein